MLLKSFSNIGFNPLGLAWCYWLEIWERATFQGLMLDSPQCQFGLANLASPKKNIYHRLYLTFVEMLLN